MLVGLAALLLPTHADAQQRCDIPREARDIWHCENGFVIGPENVIIRLPIPETDPEALYNAGVEAARREDWRVAIAYFTAAQQRAHLVPKYMYNLGLAHARAGHDLPAIAWLTAYLTAAPDAPNRAAVWGEIAQHEARVESNLAALWDASERAANRLPSIGSYMANERWMDYGFLATQAATLSDLVRARSYLTTRMAFCRNGPGTTVFSSPDECPASVEADFARGDYLLMARYCALAYDFDEAAANVITLQAGAAAANWSTDLLEQVRRERLVTLPYSYFEPGFRNYAFLKEPWADPMDMARAGEWGALLAAAREHPPTTTLRILPYQAVTNDSDRLFARLSEVQRGDTTENWEYIAASAGQIFLLRGDRANAERAYSESQRFLRTDTSGGGLSSLRLQALLAVDSGQTDEALLALEVASSRIAIREGEGDPTPMWWRIRGAPPAMLAEYLIGRGRVAEALAMIERAGSLRRAAFYESVLSRPGIEGQTEAQMRSLLEATLVVASDNCSECIQRRVAIENAVTDAMSLSGLHSDLPARLREIASIRNGHDQIVALGWDITSFGSALRRIRGLYRRSGGVWGQ